MILYIRYIINLKLGENKMTKRYEGYLKLDFDEYDLLLKSIGCYEYFCKKSYNEEETILIGDLQEKIRKYIRVKVVQGY